MLRVKAAPPSSRVSRNFAVCKSTASADVEVRGRRPGESPHKLHTRARVRARPGGYRRPNPSRIRLLGWSGLFVLRSRSLLLASRSSACSSRAAREGEGGAEGGDGPQPIRASSASISASVISTSRLSASWLAARPRPQAQRPWQPQA